LKCVGYVLDLAVLRRRNGRRTEGEIDRLDVDRTGHAPQIRPPLEFANGDALVRPQFYTRGGLQLAFDRRGRRRGGLGSRKAGHHNRCEQRGGKCTACQHVLSPSASPIVDAVYMPKAV